jgi:hypothetical protein
LYLKKSEISNMKGISYIIDDRDQKKSLVIDLKTIEDHQEEVHDLIDAIIAESRKGEEAVDWDDAKTYLKSIGKL